MKIFKDSSPFVVVFSSIVLIMLILNLVLEIHPVLSLFNYIESKKFYWTIPSTAIFLTALWLFDRSMRRKIINERTEIYNATIRTIQDLLQNSTSSMQLLVMDMIDENVKKELITSAEKNIEELKRVVGALALIDPKTIELKELNRKLSIIRMDEELQKIRKVK